MGRRPPGMADRARWGGPPPSCRGRGGSSLKTVARGREGIRRGREFRRCRDPDVDSKPVSNLKSGPPSILFLQTGSRGRACRPTGEGRRPSRARRRVCCRRVASRQSREAVTQKHPMRYRLPCVRFRRPRPSKRRENRGAGTNSEPKEGVRGAPRVLRGTQYDSANVSNPHRRQDRQGAQSSLGPVHGTVSSGFSWAGYAYRTSRFRREKPPVPLRCGGGRQQSVSVPVAAWRATAIA